jgi:hypothetical protein
MNRLNDLNLIDIPAEHFDLQYRFAQKASELTGKDIATCLMEFTAFYKRIGIADWDFNPANLLWLSFVGASGDLASEAFRLYCSTLDSHLEAKKEETRFGCFRFQIEGDGEVASLHFKNRDGSQPGPLSIVRMPQRLDELRLMFGFIKENHPETKQIKGGSWLYNYPSYRRLFPSIFTENMSVQRVPFPRSSGIWGQFINSERQLNQQLASEFEQKFMQANSEEELLQSFPFRILSTKSPIEYFYEFYGLDN